MIGGRRSYAIEQFPEISHTVVLGIGDTIKGIEHSPIARLVERELASYLYVGLLEGEEWGRVWHGHHHSITIDVRDVGSKVIV